MLQSGRAEAPLVAVYSLAPVANLLESGGLCRFSAVGDELEALPTEQKNGSSGSNSCGSRQEASKSHKLTAGLQAIICSSFAAAAHQMNLSLVVSARWSKITNFAVQVGEVPLLSPLRMLGQNCRLDAIRTFTNGWCTTARLHSTPLPLECRFCGALTGDNISRYSTE